MPPPPTAAAAEAITPWFCQHQFPVPVSARIFTGLCTDAATLAQSVHSGVQLAVLCLVASRFSAVDRVHCGLVLAHRPLARPAIRSAPQARAMAGHYLAAAGLVVVQVCQSAGRHRRRQRLGQYPAADRFVLFRVRRDFIFGRCLSRDLSSRRRSFINYATYQSMFGHLVAGPVVRYNG